MHSRRFTSSSSLVALLVSASALGLVACGSGDDAVIDDDTGIHDDTAPFDSGTVDSTPKDSGKDSGTDTADSTVADTGTDTADSTVADSGTDTADSTVADSGTDAADASDVGTDTADSTTADVADAADTADAAASDASDAADTADAVVADASDAASDATDAASDSSDAGPAPTEIWVVRVNTGATTSEGAATFVDKFLSDGTSKGSITLPGTTATAPQHLFTLASGAATEGALALSGDGHYVTLGGYAAAIGTATVATGSTRVVARIDASGTVDTSTTFPSSNLSPFRAVVTSNGTDIWTAGTASGTAGGVHYITLGASTDSGNLASAPTNVRTVGIFGGQLYFATASTPYIGLNAYGTALPTTTGQTATLLAGFPGSTSGSSPYAFVALDTDSTAGIDTIYVADDNGTTAASNPGGIQRWKLSGTSWTKASVNFVDSTVTGTFKSVTAEKVGADVVVYCATTTALYKFTDVGAASTTAPSFTKVADAPSASAFRGIALAPK